ALPEDPPDVEPERVALRQMIVEHRGQQVVRGRDRVHVAGEVQIDIFHRRDLGMAAARPASLHAEHGAERGLADRHDRALAEAPEPVGQPDRRRRLSFARRGRRHRRHEDEGSVGTAADTIDDVPPDLRLVASVRLEVTAVQSKRLADRLDRLELHGACDVDVLFAHYGILMSAAPRVLEPPRSDSGRIGSLVICTPRWRTASATAFAIAAGAPIVPPSPIPLTPSGVTGESVSRWAISNEGKSSALGSA